MRSHSFQAFLLAIFVSGLSLTQAHAANSHAPMDPNLTTLHQLAEHPVDYGVVKVTLDHMVDPSVDVKATLHELDGWAEKVRVRLPPNADHYTTFMVLGSTFAVPGPWNDNRPFSYDLSDPFGKNIRNKLVSEYLKTRKGNCVSMPILLLILGQKLGLDMALATAPNHNLVMFRQDDGTWVNIEATSGTAFSNEEYQRQLYITPIAMHSGIYLRPLSPAEAVGAMGDELGDYYEKARKPKFQLDLTAYLLEINPKDTVAMIRRADAYYRLLDEKYFKKYPTPNLIPAADRADFQMLSKSNAELFQQAEALGGFYPVNADTSKKTDHGQKGVSCPSEESSATSSSVRPLA
ncbi:hypothetical protein EAH88_15335 [Rhodanobacter glycinis]|uniref:Protein SirB1 N-terminal domain-containing protein n=1 Tax=Rhodanobacter glycinis TaxID=582702 RepID=A0A502BVN8_9GAMM|nr:transglutaminase family protein [Rhodanobacter glycinis]TPG05345.1 hypothetical protein EAH88_15335 [Rhodanobacter glycinis]